MILYRLTNKTNGKIYFGITVRTLHNRWIRHKSSMNLGSPYPIHRAMRKYGVENFLVEEISSFETIQSMKDAEIHHIAQYNSTNPDIGYNITKGGGGTFGVMPSADTRNKIRQGVLRAKNEGRAFGDDWYQKNLIARKKQIGVPLSHNHRANIAKALKGRTKPEGAGKQPIAIDQFTKEGVFIQTYSSYGDAARSTASDVSDIMRCCQGKRKSVKGFVYKYH